jgi:hypothetical protein
MLVSNNTSALSIDIRPLFFNNTILIFEENNMPKGAYVDNNGKTAYGKGGKTKWQSGKPGFLIPQGPATLMTTICCPRRSVSSGANSTGISGISSTGCSMPPGRRGRPPFCRAGCGK